MDKAITWTACTVAALMAATAGWLSYSHGLYVARVLGVHAPDCYAYPAIVDGLIYLASMALLRCARLGLEGPIKIYAWCVLGLGIVITGAVNAWAGISHGPWGAVAYAMPAVVLVLSYELLMLIIRNAGAAPAAPVPGVRALMETHKIGYPKAKAMAEAMMNGGK